VAPAGPGPRGVEEDVLSAPRFTARRREREVKRMPTGRVRITKPRAKTKNTDTLAVSFSMISFIRPEASATPMIEATVVFFVKAMSTEPSGAIEPRKACGRITLRRLWVKVRPMERAASA
jgi:hypothetical protein